MAAALNHPSPAFDMTMSEKSAMPTLNENFWSRRSGYRYEINAVINEGGFGMVFRATCLTRRNSTKSKFSVALKVEKWDKTMQPVEVAVLKAARLHSCNHFPELIDYGSVFERFHFIALTLMGNDLYRLRKKQPGAVFSISTALRAGYQTMQAIEELQMKCRYICRDIKPSNFVIGLEENNAQRRMFIVDFGLCRRYVDANNNVLQSRGEVGWRGTSRYGSLQCHLRMDLGRKDDIESWFYMLVECTTGRLPWQSEKSRDVVHTLKITARTSGRGDFLAHCPEQYDDILNKIDGMVFNEEPDYAFFYNILTKICTERKVSRHDAYDWERKSSSLTLQKKTVSTPSEPYNTGLLQLKNLEDEEDN